MKTKNTRRENIAFALGVISLAILLTNNLGQLAQLYGKPIPTTTINILAMLAFLLSTLYFIFIKK